MPVFADRIVELRRVRASELLANPANWRTHDAEQSAALRSVLEKIGYASALVARSTPDGSLMLIDGHLRQSIDPDAMLPVLVTDLNEAEAAEMLAKLDPLAAMAGVDADKLESLLRSLAAEDGQLDSMLKGLAEENDLDELLRELREKGTEWSDGDSETIMVEALEDIEGDSTLRAPFPYYGGKSRVASLVWSKLGDVKSFAEPFFGSGAVLLGRPSDHTRQIEVANDKDCYLANFWRAIKADPAAVADHCDWPVNEADLHSRHRWLVDRTEFREKMMSDPDYFDPQVAGWWVWGISCWIGGGWCNVDAEKLHKPRPALGGKGARGVHKQEGGEVAAWFASLATRLRSVRVCCGDWSRVVTEAALGGDGSYPFGVFLDPPYADTAERAEGLYAEDSTSVAHAVREWCLEHGDDDRYRICLAGFEGEHRMPKSWKCIGWSSIGTTSNPNRERLWFSPHCL